MYNHHYCQFLSALKPCIYHLPPPPLALSTPLGFPGGSAGKESARNAGDLGSVPGLGRSSGEGKGYPLHYSGLENSMDSPWGCKESDTTERLSLSLCYSETQTGECSSKKEASDLLSLYNISLQEQNK